MEENRGGFNLIIELSIIVHFESGVQSLKRGRHFSNPIIYIVTADVTAWRVFAVSSVILKGTVDTR